MGKEQKRCWQHFCFCIIFLICGYCCGCAKQQIVQTSRPQIEPPPQPIQKCKEENEHLQRSEELLAKGNYAGALAENRKILAAADNSLPKDAALYNIGLIYAHYKNPKRDYNQSIKTFNKLIHNYPHSSFAEQAKVWVELIRAIENLKKVDTEVEEKLQE
jgi:outer membrane protein assembly factor BamD (BamD/ComL family)